MNIDELRTVQTKERQKDSLQHLRDEFYEDVADYIRELKAERNRAADGADDPFSDPEVSRLTDEIETAEEVVEAVYERRVGKVVKLSSFAAADMPVDEEGLTAQERDLFEDLVARIGENKTRVLDILAGQGDAGKAAASPPTQSRSETDADAFGGTEETPGVAGSAGEAEVDAPESPTEGSPARSEPAFGMGDDSDTDAGRPETDPSSNADDTGPQAPPDAPPSNAADEVVESDQAADVAPSESDRPGADDEPAVQSSTPDVDPEMVDADADASRTTVRVTADVGHVLGVDDREYELKREDVVDLPSDNADALLQRDAAEKLE